MSFDQEAELLYVPVGNANPAFYGGNRPGDNLYTNSVVVLDVNDGELQWYFQVEPHGVHNWDTSQAGPLFTSMVNGVERDVLAATGKRGQLLLLDRGSHDLLVSVPVTTMKNVEEPLTAAGVHVCPGYLGGVQWNGPAYNPGTGLLYVPAVDWCSVFFERPDTPRGGGYEFDPLESANGWVTAVDPTNGTIRWQYRGGAPMIAAVTTTSGNLVFTGTLAGNFLALNALDGEELYRFNTGGSMAGGVVTYEIDQRQYVAAASGNQSGLWSSTGSPLVVIFSLP
jgi:alcohol dehydrogenase (cytochrome c)